MFYSFKIRKNTNLVVFFKILLAVIIVANLAFIWTNSAKESTQSNKSSKTIARPVTEYTVKDFDNLTKAEQNKKVAKVNVKIRSVAHYAEFIPLGFFAFLLTLAFLELRRRDFWYFVLTATVTAVMFSAFCALTDEIHQIFVKGRTFQWIDILTDSLGALTGCFFAMIISLIFKNKLFKKEL